MKKLVLSGILIVCASIFYVGAASIHQSTHRACFSQNSCFFVEIAATDASRQRGLMYRTHLGNDKGMLFIFDTPGQYPFWMKNTLIPLDIIWIGTDKTIVSIVENAQPCGALCPLINPEKTAQYVLEIRAGQSGRVGLKVGDTMAMQ